jgi:DNA-binding Lrp family transcriptional regulator
MHGHPDIEELDYRILHALQIEPRASWSLVASALGTAPATVARHWAELARSGTAWVTCEPPLEPGSAVAIVELECRPGTVMATAHQLAEDPQAVSIEITAGGRDLMLIVAARSRDSLNHYLLERLHALSDVHRLHIHLNVAGYARGSQWRLRALHPSEAARLSVSAAASSEGTLRRMLDDVDWNIVRALSVDGRATTSELAASAGVSTSTAHRRLARLLADGGARLRCDLATSVSGWTTTAWLFLRCPSAMRAATGRALARVPEVRATVSTAGPYNLVVALWLHSLADLEAFEIQLGTNAPHIEVADRSVVIRAVKRVGRVLDADGFTADVVPCDLRPAGSAILGATR